MLSNVFLFLAICRIWLSFIIATSFQCLLGNAIVCSILCHELGENLVTLSLLGVLHIPTLAVFLQVWFLELIVKDELWPSFPNSWCSCPKKLSNFEMFSCSCLASLNVLLVWRKLIQVTIRRRSKLIQVRGSLVTIETQNITFLGSHHAPFCLSICVIWIAYLWWWECIIHDCWQALTMSLWHNWK